MLTVNSLPKIQHYVPQFILRRFTVDNRSKIFVFDKENENIFTTNIKNIASEKGFYNLDIEECTITIEPSLSNLEANASLIFEKIEKSEDLSIISDDEKKLISVFITVQLLRVKNKREMLLDMDKKAEEKLRSLGMDPSNIKNFKTLNEDEIKLMTLKMLTDPGIIPYLIYDKMWLLFKTTESEPFYISDNPVTRQNLEDFRPFYGNLGLAVKGIEIYYPFSKKLTLGMFCISHEEKIRENYNKYCFILKNDSEKASIFEESGLLDIYEGLEFGCAIPLKNESLIKLNSLQVAFASRFIFSSTEDFELAKKMIADNPQLKSGPKIVVS